MKEGVFSWWKGQQQTILLPARFRGAYWETISSKGFRKITSWIKLSGIKKTPPYFLSLLLYTTKKQKTLFFFSKNPEKKCFSPKIAKRKIRPKKVFHRGKRGNWAKKALKIKVFPKTHRVFHRFGKKCLWKTSLQKSAFFCKKWILNSLISCNFIIFLTY